MIDFFVTGRKERKGRGIPYQRGGTFRAFGKSFGEGTEGKTYVWPRRFLNPMIVFFPFFTSC